METRGAEQPRNLSLATSLAIQWRVIWAMILREMLTRYGRNNVGILWLFLEPMIFVLVITGIWSATRSVHNSSIPVAAFALTGYSSMLLWRTLPGRCIGAVESNKTLLHHRYVKVLDIFIARILLEQGAVTTSFAVLAVVMALLGWIDPPEDVLQLLAGWLLLTWFGASLALTLAGLAARWSVIQKFWTPFSVILFPFSGAAFIVDALPDKVREVILYLPMVHGVEYIREGFFGTRMVAHYDLFYLFSWNMSLLLFGLSQVRRIGADQDLL